ncbi:MAG: class I SAM-dependent methyltransferase [Chitinophagaceae bacterium]|nr:class I SAM-dependent methyltransferase [Chitinophagaceae bacterium]
MNLRSPITYTSRVRYIDSIPSDLIIKLYKKQDGLEVSRYFKNIDEVKILQCEDTLLRFYYPFSLCGDEDFYKQLKLQINKKGLSYDRDNEPDHLFALSKINPGESVLEIGCGTGKFLERLSPLTKNYLGIELNQDDVSGAQKKALPVKKILIEELAKECPDTFDVVYAFRVLEHISDIKSFFQSSIQVLKKGVK